MAPFVGGLESVKALPLGDLSTRQLSSVCERAAVEVVFDPKWRKRDKVRIARQREHERRVADIADREDDATVFSASRLTTGLLMQELTRSSSGTSSVETRFLGASPPLAGSGHAGVAESADAPPRSSLEVRALVLLDETLPPQRDRWRPRELSRPVLTLRESGDFCDAQAARHRKR